MSVICTLMMTLELTKGPNIDASGIGECVHGEQRLLDGVRYQDVAVGIAAGLQVVVTDGRWGQDGKFSGS